MSLCVANTKKMVSLVVRGTMNRIVTLFSVPAKSGVMRDEEKAALTVGR